MKILLKKYSGVILVPAILAGCGGEETVGSLSGGGSGGGSGSTTLPFTTSSTLLASFLDNLDGVRAAATQLITTDARYLLQDAPDGYYSDMNGNGTFESGIDVRLLGSPLKHAGVHYAHAAGLTGSGEVIAFSDSGFLTTHEALAGKSITTIPGAPVEDHGTFVASVAAGNSAAMIGVAPGADLILGSFNTYSELSDTADAAASAGAVALNNSWGFVNVDATTANFNSFTAVANAQDYLDSLENYAQDGIVVFSVDNDHTRTSVGLLPGLPIFDSDLEESWIAVVNGVPVMVDDDIISAQRVSSACLEAAAWCISADGSWTGASSASNSSYEFGTGTSYSAPTVSGALALLAEAFPTMTHQELRIRLFASADNDFAGFTSNGTVELVPGFEHEYSTEWGHGFLDVAAALLPIGQSVITTGSGVELNPEDPLVVTGGASGDAVARALSSVNVISKDALAAEFSVSASALVIDAPTLPLFSNNDVANFDYLQNASFGTTSFFGQGQEIPLNWGDSDVSLAIFQSNQNGTDTFGFGASRRFDFDGGSIAISTAFGDDTGAMLSDWNGGTEASIFSAGFGLSADLSATSEMGFEIGYAAGREASGLGQSADVLMNSAALSFTRRNAFARNDQFKLSVSLPAAVTTGSTSLSLPVRSEIGGVTLQDVPIDLAPDKRELRVALTYSRPLSRVSSLGISLAHAQNRGNIAGKRETGLMVSFNRSF